MLDTVLRIASRIPHPMMVGVVAAVLAAGVLVFAVRAHMSFLARTVWIALAAVVLALGFAPAMATSFIESRGLYRVRLVVVEPDQSLADFAQVKSSTGGDLKMVRGGWELEIPRQSRPADGKVTFSAVVRDEFRTGSSILVLDEDYYPTVTVQLADDTSAMVRGVVVDEDLRAVAGASVSIAGYPNVAVTDTKGNFVLPAHAGKGQSVEIHAHKGPLSGRLSAPAGKVVEIIVSSE